MIRRLTRINTADFQRHDSHITSDINKPDLFIFVLHTQYFSGDKIEQNVKGGVIARMGERRGAYRFGAKT
jgi:hypothetical protein